MAVRPALAGTDPPLYETIYAVLRAQIEGGQLPPGLVLGATGVARAFKASRSPAGVALRRLQREGLIATFGARGYVVAGDVAPLRLGLEAAGLELPASIEARGPRNSSERIYPEVEHAVAAGLAYGRFLLNESALAEHYGVSRTVAHEVLTRLERTGIVTQDRNQRWYAGPLTPEGIRQHFEIRWLLEPAALRQAFPHLGRSDLIARRARVDALLGGQRSAIRTESIERDLHFHTLKPCGNSLLLDMVRRSQLPLLATHSAFEHRQRPAEITTMAHEHRVVYDRLIAGDSAGAAAVLEAHLRRSVEPTIELWHQLGEVPETIGQAYLTRVD